MKVYVVTSGSYSDYGINCIFSSRERAEQYIKVTANGYDEFNSIREWDVDKHVQESRKPFRFYEQSCSLDTRKNDEGGFYYLDDPHCLGMSYEKVEGTSFLEKRDNYHNLPTYYATFVVWAEDVEHANKIIQDKWAQHKQEMIDTGQIENYPIKQESE